MSFYLLFTSLQLILIDLRMSGADSNACRSWVVGGMEKHIHYYGGCYIKSTFALTWADTRDFCSNNGGNLFMPFNLLKSQPYITQYDCVFIGLYWDSTIGWKWLDGSLPTIDAWNRSAIRPVNNALFPYAAMCQGYLKNGHVEFSWHQRSCESKLEFICEYVPTPIRLRRPRKGISSAATKKQRAISFRVEPYSLLSAKPGMETKTFSGTMCARQCQKRLTPCLVLNYNSARGICLGFSSMEVIAEGKSRHKDWVMLVAL